MKVIFLTQYFPPETGAPQNRLFATAQALVANGAEVTVLTAMPNYPDMRIHADYRGKWHTRSEEGGMTVHRVWLLVSQSRSIFWRLCNYFSFVFTAFVVGLFKLRRSEVLFVESPPLFLGITAMWLARAKRGPAGLQRERPLAGERRTAGHGHQQGHDRRQHWLEERCYERSALVTGQTMGIVADIKTAHAAQGSAVVAQRRGPGRHRTGRTERRPRPSARQCRHCPERPGAHVRRHHWPCTRVGSGVASGHAIEAPEGHPFPADRRWTGEGDAATVEERAGS